MTNQNINDKIEHDPTVGQPEEAEPGKGASGAQWGVQLAQNPNTDDPSAKIPSDVDVEENVKQVKAVQEQEEGTLPTTHGYVVGESGKLNNFAVEPPMEVEED